MLAERVLELDFSEIEDWYMERDVAMPDLSLFPPVGFIVRGIAAGFIYFTDSAVAILDGYISNPNTLKEDRDEALDEITCCLIAKARAAGVKRIKCDTALKAISDRAKKFKFQSTGYYESFVLESE